MRYLQYIESEDWKLLRAAKLKLSGYACEACKKKTPHPHVHHVIYRLPIESGQIDDLRIMCDRCHNRWHTIERRGEITQWGSVEARWNQTVRVLKKKERPRKSKFKVRFQYEKANLRRERIGFSKPVTKWVSMSERERHELALERLNGF